MRRDADSAQPQCDSQVSQRFCKPACLEANRSQNRHTGMTSPLILHGNREASSMGRGKNHPHIADLVSLRREITLFLAARVPLGSKQVLISWAFEIQTENYVQHSLYQLIRHLSDFCPLAIQFLIVQIGVFTDTVGINSNLLIHNRHICTAGV